MLEPAKNAHGFTAHRGFRVLQGLQGRPRRLVQAQFAQGAQGAGADKALGMVDPRQNQRARFQALQFAEALGRRQPHRFGGIGQGSAQCLHHFRLLPGFQQARGFGANLGGRVHQQRVGKPRQAIGIFQVGQVDQGDAAHGGVAVGQARQQFEDVGVVAGSFGHRAIRSGGWSLSGRPSGVRRGSSRPSSWRSKARQ